MRRLVTSLAAIASLASAATASAATRCVPAPCTGDAQYATIAEAVTAADADPDPDVVQIGAGTFNLTRTDGMVVRQGIAVQQATTELRGAGRGRTILTLDPHRGESYGYSIVRGYMSGLSDLTLRLPSVETTGNGSVTGADVYDGAVRRVDVDAPGATFGPSVNDGEGYGMLLRAGSIDDLRIAFDPATDTSGLRVLGSPSATEIDGLDVTAGDDALLVTMARPAGGAVPALRVGRARLASRRPVSVAGGEVELADATVTALPNAEGAGIGLGVSSGYTDTPTTLTADRVTVVGDRLTSAQSHALGVGAFAATSPATLVARHLVATGFATTLNERAAATGTTRATVSRSVLSAGPDAVVTTTSGTGTAVHDLLDSNRAGDPRLGADLVPQAGSPAIDVGGSDLVASQPVDLAGRERVTDGDGDGTAAIDAGALEAPTFVAPPSAPADAGAGGGGAGTGTPAVTPVTSTPADVLAPGLRAVRLSARRFSAGAVRAGTRRRPARGTRVRLDLTEAAGLEVAVQRARSGRRTGGRCRVGARRGRRCTRWAGAGEAAPQALGAGAQRFDFTGVIAGRPLRPGRYRLVLRAVDAAGNGSPPVRVGFRVV